MQGIVKLSLLSSRFYACVCLSVCEINLRKLFISSNWGKGGGGAEQDYERIKASSPTSLTTLWRCVKTSFLVGIQNGLTFY